MNKSIFHLVILVSVLSLVLTSCKKDEGKEKEILTSCSWKLSVYKVNGTEEMLEDCQKDNYITFFTDGTYTDFTGPLKCDDAESDYTSTWVLSENGKIITLGGEQEAGIDITESRIIMIMIDDSDTIEFTLVSFYP